MKLLLIFILTLLSAQTFAFTSVELKQATTLTRQSERLFAILSDSKGSDYCQVYLTSDSQEDKLVIPAGTVFESVSIEQNGCGRDWGRQCRLDLSGENAEQGVRMALVCKDKGMFAKELSPAKVNSIAKKIISVK